MVRDPNTANKVVVAFTTYNPERAFKDHLEVAASECEHVLVVDDGSDRAFDGFEGSGWIPAGVRVMRKRQNAGIADSVNRALRYSMQLNAEYLIFFDQDTVVCPGLIFRIVESALSYRSSSQVPFGCLGAGVIHGRGYVSEDTSGIFPVPEVIQAGTVFSVEALHSIGGANSALIIDAVDTDMCLRLRERGYNVVVDSAISIFHPVGSGHSVDLFGHSVLVTNHSCLRRYYMTRNRVFILRQLRWWRFDTYWCLVYLRRFVVSCVIGVVAEEDRLLKLRAIVYGLTDGLKGRLGKKEL